jgi:hypothetical protein
MTEGQSATVPISKCQVTFSPAMEQRIVAFLCEFFGVSVFDAVRTIVEDGLIQIEFEADPIDIARLQIALKELFSKCIHNFWIYKPN